MKVWEWSARVIASFVLCCVAMAGAETARAQNVTVSVSPTDLSFGVATGTSPAVSAQQTVTVNITGSGTVNFGVVAATTPGTKPSDFGIVGNSCSGAIVAPNICQVSVVFTASLAPASTLEKATLSIASDAGPNTLLVPMNGAFGAIELFGALNVNPSHFPTTWPNSAGNPVKTTTVALSCPANPTAVLSSTPDGLSDVFQDNTIQVADTVASVTTTTTNVCYGGDTNFQNFAGFPAGTSNCFQQPYESAARGFIGQNPDLATNLVATYGVQPLNLMTPPFHNVDGDNDADDHHPLFASILTSGMQSLNVELVDAGGDLGAATLHLVTNCTLAGAVPGGTITGDPITSGDTSSQTQVFAFDNGGGQNISLTSSVSTAVQGGTVNLPSGIVPSVKDIGIPQALFSQLVAGKSSAPAVCVRMTGELDSFGQPLCKGYLIQCTDSSGMGAVTGDNCVPNASNARNLFDVAQFSSPDAPEHPSTNFLSTSCAAFLAGQGVSNGTCAASSDPSGAVTTLIGPGILLGSDNWLCAPNSDLTNCTNQELNTNTATTPPSYNTANCHLTGTLFGNVCPLDTLTQFKGAADQSHGSTTNGKNSLFIPVVNMPLPFTQTTITGLNGNGWVNTTSLTVQFTANQATYAGSLANSNPDPNGFNAVPPYSVTYGITPAADSNQMPVPIPDTTFPVAGDQTLYNAGTAPNFGSSPPAPICTIGGDGATPNPFSTSASLAPGTPLALYSGEGIYNLHYFATDCAFTEELLFNPTTSQLSDPTANWASFRTLAFGVDNMPPALTCPLTPSSPDGNNNWYRSNVTTTCSATDDLSGFNPGTAVFNTNVKQGPTTTSLPMAGTGVATGAFATAAMIPTQTISDLAGNPASQGFPPFPIDMAAPTISGTFSVSGTTFTVGQTVTLKYACTDMGSGLANCGGVPTSCPLAPSAGAPSFSTTPVTIDTAAAGPHTINTSATDCANNVTPLSLNYTVVLGSADLFIATLPSPLANVKSGSNLTYRTFVLNLGPNTANNVVVTDTIPNGTTFVSAISGTVTCTLAGCSDVASGTACGGSGNVVTCSTPTVKPITSITGFVVKMVVNVTGTVSPVKDTASVTGSNPDPHTGNNTVTVSTTVKH